ncbi:hypothetical protein [Pseudolysinimonas sp.]|jgi:hypothetical protein|uniref:hypothetical protein n=1 Tax=Pseudolysinimonas sp. TaxID=2680009 RepID=UPI0037852A01
MTLPPPSRPHYQGEPGQYRPVQLHHVQAQAQALAPTLGQYIRSDTRTLPGRRAPKWAGRVAFWIGMLAAVLFLGEAFVTGELGLLAAIATPLSLVAILFALIAIIAGVGRGLGIFGLVFALAGNALFWSWLDRTFG